VETSLKTLETDHIDVIQLHSLTDKDRIFIPETREALLTLKQQGKVRFFGVTTHKNQLEVLNALVDDKDRFFDTCLVAYNFESSQDVAAGIGIIAMKTQAGGYKTEALGKISPHQAALKFALRNQYVTMAIPGMKDLSQFRENVAVMGMTFKAADARILQRYHTAVAGFYCDLCGACEGTCTRGVDISTVNRSLMYAEGYRDRELARSTYRELPRSLSADACLDCPVCTAQRPEHRGKDGAGTDPAGAGGLLKKTMRTTSLVSLLLVAVLLAARIAPAADQAMIKRMPSPACAEGWVMDGNVTLFDKDSLFDRVNGEAELFFPYGFKVLAYARYESKQNPKIAIDMDVYRVGSLLDAFGLFSIFRRKDDAGVSIGTGGTISPSQLFFYQDKYFVRLQVTGATSVNQEVLRSCAGSLSRNLPEAAARPRALDALAVPAVVNKSERYMAQSLLGYAFFTKGLVADAVLKGETVQVFLVTEGTAEAARRTMAAYGAYLKTSGIEPRITGDKDRSSLEGVDPLYGKVVAERSGPSIVGAVRVKDVPAAKQLVEEILRRCR